MKGMKTLLLGALLLAATPVFAGSVKEYRAAPRRLSVLLYFNAGDSGLNQADSDKTIQGMEAALADLSPEAVKDVNFVVQIDGEMLDGQATGPGRYYIAPSRDHRKTVSRVSGNFKAAADPAVSLDEFLSWANKQYPAKDTVLILGGHGTAAGAAAVGGNGDHQFVSASGLAMILRSHTRPSVIAFENCLTQTVEFLYELRGAADYLVGSEEVLTAFDYRDLARRLVEGRSSEAWAKAFTKVYREGPSTTGRSEQKHTLSAVRSADIPQVAAAVRDWSSAAYKDCYSLIAAHRYAKSYQGDTESKDLGDLMRLYRRVGGENPKLAEAVTRAVDRAVVDKAFPENGSGIAIFLPRKVDPEKIQGMRYTSLKFVRQGYGRPWLKFLRSLSFVGEKQDVAKTPDEEIDGMLPPAQEPEPTLPLGEPSDGVGVSRRAAKPRAGLLGRPGSEDRDACPAGLAAIFKRLEGRKYSKNDAEPMTHAPY